MSGFRDGDVPGVGGSSVKLYKEFDGYHPAVFRPSLHIKSDAIEDKGPSGEALTVEGSVTTTSEGHVMSQGSYIAPTDSRSRHQLYSPNGICAFMRARMPSVQPAGNMFLGMSDDADGSPPGFYWGLSSNLAFYWDGTLDTAWTHSAVIFDGEIHNFVLAQTPADFQHDVLGGGNRFGIWETTQGNGAEFRGSAYSQVNVPNALKTRHQWVNQSFDEDVTLIEYAFFHYIPPLLAIIEFLEGSAIEEAGI